MELTQYIDTALTGGSKQLSWICLHFQSMMCDCFKVLDWNPPRWIKTLQSSRCQIPLKSLLPSFLVILRPQHCVLVIFTFQSNSKYEIRKRSMDVPLGFHFYESFSTLGMRPQDISRVSGNLLGIGDGFPNISLVLMEHGYSASSTSDGIFFTSK